MEKTNKELAVELSIAIINNLRHEPMIGEDGKPMSVAINELLNGCYEAISKLGNDAQG